MIGAGVAHGLRQINPDTFSRWDSAVARSMKEPNLHSEQGRSQFLAGAREMGLHGLGAVVATTVLVLSLSVTLKMRPPGHVATRSTFGAPVEELWWPSADDSASSSAENGNQVPAMRIYLSARGARRTLNPHIPTRVFTPPPPVVVPSLLPEYPEDSAAPLIASIDAEAVLPPVPEFALPARPRRRVVRVLAALSNPFRSITAFFRGRETSSPTD